MTDHRINLTLHSLAAFMEGDIAEMSDALLEADAAERLAEMAGGTPAPEGAAPAGLGR